MRRIPKYEKVRRPKRACLAEESTVVLPVDWEKGEQGAENGLG